MKHEHDSFDTDLMEEYKGYRIRKDVTIRKFKVYSVINNKVLFAGSIEILKRKIDKEISTKQIDINTKRILGRRNLC